MIEWAKTGREILTRRTDISPSEREVMEVQIKNVESAGLAFQREKAIKNAAGREPSKISKAFAALYPQYVGKKFAPDLQAVLAVDAIEEARRFNHNYLGTEHLVLGLLHEGNPAGLVLQGVGADVKKVRLAVEFIMGRVSRPSQGDLQLTPKAQRLIDFSVWEAKRLGHPMVTGEHLLLGLAASEGMGAGILESLGVSLTRVRDAVLVAQQARSNG